MERRSRRDLEVLGVRRWREWVADRKNVRTLFDRQMPTVGSSASGRRKRITDSIFRSADENC